MRSLLVLAVALLLVPAASAHPSADRPVALVAAETANEVLAVSLGPHGGHVLKRVRLEDPLMVAAPLHGPAVVVDPHGTVTLLGCSTRCVRSRSSAASAIRRLRGSLRRPLRLCRGRRQRDDLRDRPRAAQDRRPRPGGPAGTSHVVAARTAAGSGSRSARWRGRSSASTRPTSRIRGLPGRLHPRFSRTAWASRPTAGLCGSARRGAVRHRLTTRQRGVS